ncbi:facilitated trehalose transporter Tret1-like [Arctopsyche grandis]|uniref:facilitated trehalose transporter Tret1-like n=1 Tax=Arctopsyche grandis TaxID=121162 RepID=UPI00406D6DF7
MKKKERNEEKKVYSIEKDVMKTQTLALTFQVLAASAQNFMLLDLGLSVSIPAVVIPSLLGAEGPLSFTQEQASWFGSISLILQPLGSVLSGCTLEPLGRKMSLLIVNIPHVIAWLMLYFAQDVTTLFCGNALIGLGIGFMEAPIVTYVGEISHPTVRGMLTAYSQIYVQLGFFLALLMGTFISWRQFALTSLAIPFITFFLILTIPETPVWLISKGRMDDAMKSLCWIRGWCKPEHVQQEFDNIVAYQKNSSSCQQCLKLNFQDEECTHRRNGLSTRIKGVFSDMTRKEMLRPLALMMFMFATSAFIGLNAIKPNIIKIYTSFGVPIDPFVTADIATGLGLLGAIIYVGIINIFGRRKLTLFSLLASSACTLLLGLYAYYTLPDGFTSYAADVGVHTTPYSWLPTVIFFVYSIVPIIGIVSVPWSIISEIFPLRGRGFACGLSAAFYYISISTATKLNLNMEIGMGIHGTFWFYSAFSMLGFVCLYFFLPETGGLTFEEIEKIFSGKSVFVMDNWITKKLKKTYTEPDADAVEDTLIQSNKFK